MRFLLIFLWGLGLFLHQPVWAASPQEAVEILYGSGDQVKTDANGYTYHIFKLNSRPPLQGLIDSLLTRLLETSTGHAICTQILESRPLYLQIYLGMSLTAAKVAARNCTLKIEARSPFVLNVKGARPRKNTFSGSIAPRKYILVRTNNPGLPVDSWTDAFNNETTFFVYHGKSSSDLNLRFLIQALAHEMAIYFDAKSWPFGPEWPEIAKAERFSLNAKNSDAIVTASLNPAIGAILSAVRAYKIEHQIVRELADSGKLGTEAINYRSTSLPFLKTDCDGTCMTDFILHQQDWVRPLYQPLLALAPQFRQRRLEELSAKVSSEDVFDVLLRSPLALIEKFSANYTALDMFLEPMTLQKLVAQMATEQVVDSFLMTDLSALAEARVSANSDSSFLDYLALPLLSDANTSMASGPRPRIRSGGTR